MRLAVVLALLLASVASAKGGRYSPVPDRSADQAEEPFVRCSELPDPAVSTTALTTATSAADLHDDIMAACGSGCIVTLAAGTYDGNVVFGDSSLKSGSITPSAEVVIRGLDRDNPPVIRATPDLKAAVVHARNVTARIRLEDVILDGRRGSQTSSVLTTVCTDTTPADGVCDTGSQSSGFGSGFYSRATTAANVDGRLGRSCLLRVTVRDTVNNGIVINQARASTVEDSTVYDIGCTTATCPALSIPANANVNSQLTQSMGIQFTQGEGNAVVGSTVRDVTKIGIECFLEAYACQFYQNAVYDTFNAGIAFTGGDGSAIGNTIYSIGYDHTPNATTNNLGNGISFTADVDYPPRGRVTISGNRITDLWGSGIQLGIPAGTQPPTPVLITVHGNSVSGACDGTARVDVAAFELGDSTAVIQEILADANVASESSSCAQVFLIRNLLHYTEQGNSVTGTTGGNAVEYDDVEQLYSYGLAVSDDINLDADSKGKLFNCTLNGGAAVTGSTSGPVWRSSCGS